MERRTLGSDKVGDEARAVVAKFHRDLVEEVARAVASKPVVVVGMAQNPVVKKARAFLDVEGIEYTYLEYGSYLSQWRRRLAIKLWAGFPTFPMVFMDGVLLGGHSELVALKASGRLPKRS
ncbi:MAG: glutaredoxin [Deltaproteobacteria bacterium]|nr:glutaredoxin [Deltaproteobacteria bacterium]